MYFPQSKCLHFYQYFAELYSHRSNVLKKKLLKSMLSTDTRFFGAEVMERSDYLYTLFSVLHFRCAFGCYSKGFIIKSEGCWYVM